MKRTLQYNLYDKLEDRVWRAMCKIIYMAPIPVDTGIGDDTCINEGEIDWSLIFDEEVRKWKIN